MSNTSRALSRLRLARPTSAIPTRYCCRRCFSQTPKVAKDEEWPQRTPLGGYYQSILNYPAPYVSHKRLENPSSPADPKESLPQKPESPSKQKPSRKPKGDSSSKASSSETNPPSVIGLEATPPPTTAQERARIVFGSRLLGPAEQANRLAIKQAQSTYVAGVLIPPRPEEPDNCCMSGCVNCVWDRYREDMEEWTAAKTEADMRLKASSSSVDADGGGSETNVNVEVGSNKIAKDMWDDEVFQQVPVGIREFMKQEKRLKERHQREGTLGG